MIFLYSLVAALSVQPHIDIHVMPDDMTCYGWAKLMNSEYSQPSGCGDARAVAAFAAQLGYSELRTIRESDGSEYYSYYKATK